MNDAAASAPGPGRVLYSGFRWDHHDEESGYHHVVASERDYVDGGDLWGGRSPIGSRMRRLNFLLIDLVTIVRAIPCRSVLLFYPEQTGYLSAPLLWLLGKKVVYVMHLGEDYWFHRSDSWFLKLRRFNLRFVDRFVTLTNQQKAVFERRFPGKVVKIPHGAWCDSLASQRRMRHAEAPRIVVVGDTYRDYALLSEIAQHFMKRYPEALFDLVGMDYGKLGGVRYLRNVVCHRRLDKAEYQLVLESAIFMLLPLQFATANNALLEGLKAGIPVICSNAHGVDEYLPDGAYVFDSLEDLGVKFEQRRSLGESARLAEAEILRAHVRDNYDWAVIRERVIRCCVS